MAEISDAFIRFLREAESILEDDRLGEASKIYADLGRKWKEVAYLLLDGSENITSNVERIRSESEASE